MADIKAKESVRGTVKTIDRAAVVSERIKSAAVRTKDTADTAEKNAAPAERRLWFNGCGGDFHLSPVNPLPTPA